ncbi:MAG: hypothetical protein EA382_02525 [Spirochaetaceae bacterium]|nr:MAG: hypothetical protein EA382_02525 [Spirochaetaceae bacterium]
MKYRGRRANANDRTVFILGCLYAVTVLLSASIGHAQPLDRPQDDARRELLAVADAAAERLELLYARARDERQTHAAYASILAGEIDQIFDEIDQLRDRVPDSIVAVLPRRMPAGDRSAAAAAAGAAAAAFSAWAVADPGYLPASRYPAPAVFRDALSGDRELAVRRYEYDPFARFVVSVAEPLLRVAPPVAQYRIGQTIGLDTADARRLAATLHAVRIDAARRRVEVPDLSLDPRRGFEGFLEDGRALARVVEFTRVDDVSRSSDEFRWAMLSALSHPFALWTLETDEQLRDARDLVREFADRAHAEALRVAAANDAFERIASTSLMEAYTRTYRAADPESAEALMRSYAATAQGVRSLAGDFDRLHVGELTVAAHWSYSHGCAVYSGANDGAGASDPGFAADVRARVAPWFDLAWAAIVPEEAMGHHYRGLATLYASMEEVIAAAERRARVVSLDAYSPQIVVARVLLNRSASFEIDPGQAIDLIGALFAQADAHGGNGGGTAGSNDGVVAAVLRETERIVARLTRVEAGDALVLSGVRE